MVSILLTLTLCLVSCVVGCILALYVILVILKGHIENDLVQVKSIYDEVKYQKDPLQLHYIRGRYNQLIYLKTDLFGGKYAGEMMHIEPEDLPLV